LGVRVAVLVAGGAKPGYKPPPYRVNVYRSTSPSMISVLEMIATVSAIQ
jgi:hypothetical protein